MADEIIYERDLLGVEHHIGTFPITADMILAFAAATGETHPLYSDAAYAAASEYGALLAPPTFSNMFVEGFRRPDIRLEFGDLTLFANQAIEPLAPIKAGDTVEARTKLTDVYAKTGRSGPMVFIVWETRFINQHGTTVLLVQDSFVRRQRGKP
ncbi:MAG: MaoC family dehydratase N-terminal domain-containing protein [Candidatus Tectimicrobiota bacterium]